MAQPRWSASPDDVVAHCLAGNAVAFSVERRLALVAVRRAYVFIQPLRDVVRLDGRQPDSPLGSSHDERWFVWQSLTGRGCATQLPTDPDGLAERLGIPSVGPEALMVRAALTELVEAIYRRTAL